MSQDTGIISVLPGEAGVSIQNLRGAYGEIATHFFCPNRASFPRFLSASLGHLIGDETQTPCFIFCFTQFWDSDFLDSHFLIGATLSSFVIIYTYFSFS